MRKIVNKREFKNLGHGSLAGSSKTVGKSSRWLQVCCEIVTGKKGRDCASLLKVIIVTRNEPLEFNNLGHGSLAGSSKTVGKSSRWLQGCCEIVTWKKGRDCASLLKVIIVTRNEPQKLLRYYY